MNDHLQNAFELLKARYGNHCEAAKNIGIAKDHYRKIRNGRANIPARTAEYILLKAGAIADLSAPQTPCAPTPAPIVSLSSNPR